MKFLPLAIWNFHGSDSNQKYSVLGTDRQAPLVADPYLKSENVLV